MYFPIFRGRQFELLALRDCLSEDIISPKIIPIVEPVKVSTTFTKTLSVFIEKNHSISIIRNPQVGTWVKDLQKESNHVINDQINQLMRNPTIISSFYINSRLRNSILFAQEQGLSIEDLILICNNANSISHYEEVVTDHIPKYNVIPDRSDFRRRIRPNRIMCEDHFPKQSRNVDYSSINTEFFSSDHLFYEDEGYKGFSDYSVVGEEYSETGFAPYAVAIHIVFFDEKKTMQVAHFVSDTNDDISDPARKFAEAAEKLVRWNQQQRLDTVGIREFESAYRNQTYPGLGIVKKLSIMHHLELMSRHLDEVRNDYL